MIGFLAVESQRQTILSGSDAAVSFLFSSQSFGEGTRLCEALSM